MTTSFHPENYSQKIIDWLDSACQHYPAKGFVVGLSGGIDSAVVVALLKRCQYPVTALFMPSETTPEIDIQHTKYIVQQLDIPCYTINIAPLMSAFTIQTEILTAHATHYTQVVQGNLQARLRMTTLYYYAQMHQYVVVGTDNACEWHMGYFTKFGDGAADITPLIHLTKSQVYQLANYLQIPQDIIDKPPSAGLWSGQTDEDEMGVTYADIEKYLNNDHTQLTQSTLQKIKFWHERSHHKRCLPLRPD